MTATPMTDVTNGLRATDWPDAITPDPHSAVPGGESKAKTAFDRMPDQADFGDPPTYGSATKCCT